MISQIKGYNIGPTQAQHLHKHLEIAATENAPQIKYDEGQQLLLINGKSTKLEVYHLYQRIIGELKNYLLDHNSFTICLSFESLNTSTAKVLFDLFKFIHLKNRHGGRVQVYWLADNENSEILDTGKDFAEIYDLDFKFISH